MTGFVQRCSGGLRRAAVDNEQSRSSVSDERLLFSGSFIHSAMQRRILQLLCFPDDRDVRKISDLMETHEARISRQNLLIRVFFPYAARISRPNLLTHLLFPDFARISRPNRLTRLPFPDMARISRPNLLTLASCYNDAYPNIASITGFVCPPG
jgi:hypothetical protein